MSFPVRKGLAFVLIFGMSGGVPAAENLPPLRVDPALLGQGARKAQAPRAAGTEAPEPKPEAAAAEAGAPPGGEAAVKPVEPPKAPARAEPQPAVVAPEKTEARIAPREAAPEPSTTAPRLQPQLAQPPLVEERAALPPLYSAHVEAGVLPPPALQTAARLSPLPPEGDQPYPVFVAASRITGLGDNKVVAEGETELRKANTTLSADRLTYWKIEDEVEAVGNVHLKRDADVVRGPKLRLNMTDSTGFFEQPVYSFTRAAKVPKKKSSVVLLPTTDARSQGAMAQAPTQQFSRLTTQAISRPPEVIAGEIVSDTRGLTTSTGSAERIEFQGENRMRLTNATYSTCSVDKPDWYAQVGDLQLDYDREVGEGSEAKLVFMDVPLFYMPWFSFSLNDRRKSGFLSPTFGSSTRRGLELTVPWYWNIAPNMDATISPRLMSKRGLQLNAEYRYLDHNYTGRARVEWLPEDRVLGKRRSGYSLVHSQNLGYGFVGNLNLNGVSDDTYFTDLSSRITTTSQTHLLRQGTLSYGGGWWTATANVQRFQTLQDPSLPLVSRPYERMPQLTLSANRPDIYGASFALNGEYVDFQHPTSVLGKRTTLYPQLSLPWETPAWYVTPKIGYHFTRYELSRQAAGVPDRLSRSLPIFSVDSGLTFERNLDWFGRDLTQTLEPRLYYLYVPTRRQDNIPVFDSAAADFNFATIFSENAFVGGDRIADANQLTAALGSRLIDPQNGQEYLRAMVGQRFYFKGQDVTLPGVPARPGGAADFLAALSGQVLPRTYADAAWQYNPRDKQTERFVIGGRWQPDFAKSLNASYRFSRDTTGAVPVAGIRQIDVSGQWPLGRGWYGVGRYNYSLREKRLVEAVGGLEYDGGCWVARFVVQRFATTSGTANTSFFVQLELNGLTRIGSNPLEILKRNVPGYGIINQPTSDPVFGAN